MKALLLGIGVGLLVSVIPDPFTLPAFALLSLWGTIRIVSWNFNATDTQRINVLLMFIGEVGVLVFTGRIKIF